MIVIFTGSREYEDRAAVRERLDQLAAEHSPLTIYVGDCPTGLDAYTREWLLQFDESDLVNHRIFYAEWARYGKRAGPIRNQAMVDATPKADRCEAFYRVGSGNIGTSNCTMFREAGRHPRHPPRRTGRGETLVKRKAITAAEQDTVSSKWRRALCYLGRPGVTSGIKRQMRRRERREGREQARVSG